MKQDDLIRLARQYFIADTGLSKANLIRKIQIVEGHLDCYATGKKQCEQMNCRWRDSCLGDASDGGMQTSVVDGADATARTHS